MKDRAKVRVFLSDRATIQIYVISLILSSLFTSSTANAVSEAKANNGWKNPIDVTVKYDATVKYKLIGLDLDTGKILEDERVIKNFNELRNIPQMEEVDLLFFERFGLLCQYLHWIPLCNSDWHTKTADSLLNSRAWQMALEDELPSSPLRTSSGLRTMYLDITLPVTFLFETGHGSVGMAQVLGQ